MTEGVTIKLFKKENFDTKLSYKKVKFIEAENSLLIFQETVAHKRQRSTDPSVRVFSSVVIVVEKYIKAIEYLVSWLQKVSLEKLLF